MLPAANASDPQLESSLFRVLLAEDIDSTNEYGDDEDAWRMSRLREHLDDAGFELVGEREAQLATTLSPTAPESLNVRISLDNLDSTLPRAFALPSPPVDDASQLLYDGRVLIWRRGYSSEARTGRLIGAKLDYLQQDLVQQGRNSVANLVRQTRAAGAEITAEYFPASKYDGIVVDDATSTAAHVTARPGDLNITRASLADVFDGVGIRRFLPALLEPSNLAEPTFRELVVAWRPEAPRPTRTQLLPRTRRGLSAVRQVLDTDGDGKVSLSELSEAVISPPRLRSARDAARRASALPPPPPPPPVEILLFRGIPIANFLMVLPTVQPNFQLADWLKLDLISLPALSLALSSLRFDSRAVDVAALSAIAVWLVRTLLLYRNSSTRPPPPAPITPPLTAHSLTPHPTARLSKLQLSVTSSYSTVS